MNVNFFAWPCALLLWRNHCFSQSDGRKHAMPASPNGPILPDYPLPYSQNSLFVSSDRGSMDDNFIRNRTFRCPRMATASAGDSQPEVDLRNGGAVCLGHQGSGLFRIKSRGVARYGAIPRLNRTGYLKGGWCGTSKKVPHISRIASA